VLCSGSLSRDVTFGDRVDGGRPPVGSPAFHCGAATTSGPGRRGGANADLRAVLADNGLSGRRNRSGVVVAPGAGRGGSSRTSSIHKTCSGFGEIELFAVARRARCRSVNACGRLRRPVGPSIRRRRLSLICCDRAGEHGLLVHLEFPAVVAHTRPGRRPGRWWARPPTETVALPSTPGTISGGNPRSRCA